MQKFVFVNCTTRMFLMSMKQDLYYVQNPMAQNYYLLDPTSNALKYHTMQVNYLAVVWNNVHASCPV